MEKLILPEQDIINAICVYVAQKKVSMPEDVEVELLYDDNTGFGAEAYVKGQKIELKTVNMIEAIRIWIDEYLNRDPFSAGIELLLDDEEGITAVIS